MRKTTKDDDDKQMQELLAKTAKMIEDNSAGGKDVLDLSRSAGSKKVLLVVPAKLLNDFQQLCAEDSYNLVEGIREAMRQFIRDSRPDDYESPENKQKDLKSLVEFFQGLQKIQQDPSTLPSQQKNTL